MHERNCFITLTFNDDNCPISLDHDYWQRFIRATRKKMKQKISYLMCGEYGEKYKRPHYHACLFGLDFDDKIVCKDNGKIRLYRSPTLEQLWPYGFSTIGQVNFQTAQYVASYIVKRATEKELERVDGDTGEVFKVAPEYGRVSLKPALGLRWFAKYADDVYPHDYIVANGKKAKPPRYYDKLLEVQRPEQYAAMKEKRMQEKDTRRKDNTPRRLRDKETVALAARNNKRREPI